LDDKNLGVDTYLSREITNFSSKVWQKTQQ